MINLIDILVQNFTALLILILLSLFILKKFKKFQKVLIVTSAMHMQRCKYLLKKNNLNYILYPVDFKADHQNVFKFSLDLARNIHLLHYGLREISALVLYKLSGKI